MWALAEAGSASTGLANARQSAWRTGCPAWGGCSCAQGFKGLERRAKVPIEPACLWRHWTCWAHDGARRGAVLAEAESLGGRVGELGTVILRGR